MAIPASEYLPSLGEDSRPYGIADNDLPVLPAVKSRPPQADDDGLVPSTWGDVDRPEGAAGEEISPNAAKDLARAGAERERAREGRGLGVEGGRE